eukprot:CAMPEP_0174753946 /NCGR_PEP_ID=MMETSP1094-20130205/105044_1 /TAXON_ID=156173 /ORGANISM="Chrysochromulina brevifilum, Strain UTEX LB 985" /LENGTH=153 /DNA_ID=CAMNT_0015959769 /DNA_START=136 /DNA_END=593 /DNA_ORIENTATION=-
MSEEARTASSPVKACPHVLFSDKGRFTYLSSGCGCGLDCEGDSIAGGAGAMAADCIASVPQAMLLGGRGVSPSRAVVSPVQSSISSSTSPSGSPEVCEPVGAPESDPPLVLCKDIRPLRRFLSPLQRIQISLTNPFHTQAICYRMAAVLPSIV